MSEDTETFGLGHSMHNRRIYVMRTNQFNKQGQRIYKVQIKRLFILEEPGKAPEPNNSTKYYDIRPHSKYCVIKFTFAFTEESLGPISGMFRQVKHLKGELELKPLKNN